MITTSGRMWKKFLNDDTFWVNGSHYEDEYITVNNLEVNEEFNLAAVADTDTVRIKGGTVILTDGVDAWNHTCLLVSHFRKWLKTQTHVDLVVTIERSKVQKLRQVVKAAGGLVVGGQGDMSKQS